MPKRSLYALTMALTRNFRKTIQARLERDPAFREALLKDGVECLLSGDVETGKTILRGYINATIGFEALGDAKASPPFSMRLTVFGLILAFSASSRTPHPTAARATRFFGATAGPLTELPGRDHHPDR